MHVQTLRYETWSRDIRKNGHKYFLSQIYFFQYFSMIIILKSKQLIVTLRKLIIMIFFIYGVQHHFQLYHGDQFQWWKKTEYQVRTTDHGQVTGKPYHLRLRVEYTLFCNLQSRAQTHAALVIGLYELLGNPTT